MARNITPPTLRNEALAIYITQGAQPAAKHAGVSPRTIQRWAKIANVECGYVTPTETGCPSAASYVRGCRCDGCTEANRVTQREVKRRRVERAKAGVKDAPHGTVSGYSNWDCRCPACTAEWARYMRVRRHAKRRAASQSGSGG